MTQKSMICEKNEKSLKIRRITWFPNFQNFQSWKRHVKLEFIQFTWRFASKTLQIALMVWYYLEAHYYENMRIFNWFPIVANWCPFFLNLEWRLFYLTLSQWFDPIWRDRNGLESYSLMRDMIWFLFALN